MASNKLRVAILGASGYTGAELVRLLARHPHVAIVALTADRQAGKPAAEVFPQFQLLDLPILSKIDDVDWSGVDFAFCALPHGLTQEVIAKLPRHLKIVDLSADFRLSDIAAYATWYGHEHHAPDLQKEAVYGLTEIKRDAVRKARLVANPGCYPTAAILALTPLAPYLDDVVIDAKSGVSGAGREPTQGSLYSEVTEGTHAYGVASHRHAPEIEQGLSEAAGKPLIVNFTPHLMPMSRGILASIYVKMAPGVTADQLRAALSERYKGEYFIRVLPNGAAPATRHVRGSNFVIMSVHADRVPNRAILMAVEDNLVKGASGQAVQNMNVMAGFPEETALEQMPMFP
jgi:N-acetyl-gamma-glutamyl-phosphate reductase